MNDVAVVLLQTKCVTVVRIQPVVDVARLSGETFTGMKHTGLVTHESTALAISGERDRQRFTHRGAASMSVRNTCQMERYGTTVAAEQITVRRNGGRFRGGGAVTATRFGHNSAVVRTVSTRVRTADRLPGESTIEPGASRPRGMAHSRADAKKPADLSIRGLWSVDGEGFEPPTPAV